MKKFGAFLSAFILSISSCLVIFAGTAHAATVVWNGEGDNMSLADDDNWVGGAAPAEGDDLVILYDVEENQPFDVINDFPDGTTFNSITFGGESTEESEGLDIYLSGNDITLTDGITVDVTGSNVFVAPQIDLNIEFDGDQTINIVGADDTLIFNGIISGSDNITKVGAGDLLLDGENTFTGDFDIDGGVVHIFDQSGLGTTDGDTSVNDGASLQFQGWTCGDYTITEDITLAGDSTGETFGGFPVPKLRTNAGCSITWAVPELLYGFTPGDGTVTFSGDITLSSDVTFGGVNEITQLTGSLSGNYNIDLVDGYSAKLVINASPNTSAMANGTYTPDLFELTLSDNQPSTDIAIDDTAVITVTGTRGDVIIGGGTLKGTGTVGDVLMSAGTIAPGMSPGILNSGNVSFTGGTHEVELGGTASGDYDQLNVTGTVALGTNTVLETSLYDGFKPAVGNSFTIINNDGSDAVTGTFKDLAEGATFEVDDYVFKISYVGGSGNDVVLSVMSVPTAPDTGFGLITNNPAISLVLLCVVTPALAYAARRSFLKS